MKLSTIIVNYDSRDEIRRLIESFRANAGDLAHEIIVVDNHGRDGLADMLRADFPQVRLVEPGRNLWFTGGNNTGFSVATGEYVYSLNPDTLILPGALQAMVAYLDAHPNVGGVTSKMLFPDGKLQKNCSRLAQFHDLLLDYTLLGALLRPLRKGRQAVMWYADWDRLSDHPVEVAPDSNLMMRRVLVERLGGYDERLKLYFTEDDICRRIWQAGSEVHYVAAAEIIHEEHTSVRKVQRMATRVYFDDLMTYTRIWWSAGHAALLSGLSFPTRAAMDVAHRLRGQ